MAKITIPGNYGNYQCSLDFNYSYTPGNNYITLNNIVLNYSYGGFLWYPTVANDGDQSLRPFITINNHQIKGTHYQPATYYWSENGGPLYAQNGNNNDVMNKNINLINGQLNITVNLYLYSLTANNQSAKYFNNITSSTTIYQEPTPSGGGDEPSSDEQHQENLNAVIKSYEHITATGLNALKSKIKDMYANRPLLTTQQRDQAGTALNTNYFQPYDNTEINQIGDLINACLVINDIPNLKYNDLNNNNDYVNLYENIFGDGTDTNLLTWLSDTKRDATGNSSAHGCRGACVGICSSGCTSECGTGCVSGCINGCKTTNQGSTGGDGGYPCRECGGSCSTMCTNTSKNQMQTGCSCGALCYKGCDGTCAAINCDSGCIGGCKNGCQEDCATGCYNGCNIGCQNNCSTYCGGNCTEACEISCQNNCATDCVSRCYGSAAGGCYGCIGQNSTI